MAPIIDDFARPTVGSINDPIMRADGLPLCNNNQPLRVNTKTDRAVRKAGGDAVPIAFKGDQARRLHAFAVFDKSVEGWW